MSRGCRRWAALVFVLFLRAAGTSGAQDLHAGHAAVPPAPGVAAQEDHTAHQEAGAPDGDYPPGIPPLTDADRAAAFPPLDGGHAVHDDAVHAFVLFDRLEWQPAGGARRAGLDVKGWVGRDRDRIWFRAEADAGEGIETAAVDVLYARQVSRWWDVVAGVRQDFRPGPPTTWVAGGLQGLAPYWFEVAATAYVSASGHAIARFDVEYDLLLTNRLVLQPTAELQVAGQSDAGRGVGRGLSFTGVGLRLRYEIRRELAPYVGVTWHRTHGEAADMAAAAGRPVRHRAFVSGARVWF